MPRPIHAAPRHNSSSCTPGRVVHPHTRDGSTTGRFPVCAPGRVVHPYTRGRSTTGRLQVARRGGLFTLTPTAALYQRNNVRAQAGYSPLHLRRPNVGQDFANAPERSGKLCCPILRAPRVGSTTTCHHASIYMLAKVLTCFERCLAKE